MHPLLPEGGLGAPGATEAIHSACVAGVDSLSRLNALAIGPGLGRDEAALAVAEALLKAAVERKLPLVIDGDGLWLVTRRPSLLAGLDAQRVILTPNVNEFARLSTAMGIHAGGEGGGESALCALSAALGGAVIVQKGEVDLIACGSLPVLRCSEQGSPRRCGGQGDVLAGLSSTFAAWAAAKARTGGEAADMQQAALAACLVTRRAARAAFALRKRSMVAGDLIEHIGEVMEKLAPAQHTADT